METKLKVALAEESEATLPKRRGKIHRLAHPGALTHTVEGACQLSGLSRATIFERLKDNTIESRLVNGRRLVVATSLRRFLGIEE